MQGDDEMTALRRDASEGVGWMSGAALRSGSGLVRGQVGLVLVCGVVDEGDVGDGAQEGVEKCARRRDAGHRVRSFIGGAICCASEVQRSGLGMLSLVVL